MTMRCKNGEPHTHETITEARMCWGHAGHTGPRILAQPVAMDTPSDGANRMAAVLADSLAKPNAVASRVAQSMAKAAGSMATDWSKPSVQVADGRYAVTLPGEDTLRFFRVKAGHKAGVLFVHEQASDDMWPVRDRARRVAILTAIAQDPQAALVRYGQELGVCGVCGRTLTDEASRAAGIGPVCAAR